MLKRVSARGKLGGGFEVCELLELHEPVQVAGTKVF